MIQKVDLKMIQSDIITCDVLILGAGLTGLTLAYYLRNSNVHVKIVEARNRIGGRIHTVYDGNDEPMEMGATWLGAKHTNLIGLLSELNIETFEQKIGSSAIYEAISTSPHYLAKLPPNPEPSLRIKGGTSKLIDGLKGQLDHVDIFLNEPVHSITVINNEVIVESKDYTFKSKLIISTLPPNLFVNIIDFSPKLSEEFVTIAQSTHTWMGESIKIGLTYKEPFWRADHLSGTIMSNVGPIPEMYDHSNFEESFFALKGFLNGNYFSVRKEVRLNLILQQLQKYFGDQVNNYLTYSEAVWRNEPFTFQEYKHHVLPHQNNGHSIFSNRFMNGKLIMAGSETASVFPGYMEGAVVSAKEVAEIACSWAK